uniref:Ig-like domain-containing protein n=1 Tax=Anguilla anguilla TaxID=7936 RepID=A0A0E9XW38_ANGAN
MQANRGVTLILLSLMTRLGSPKDVLTLQPNRPLFFTGETVTLRCSGRHSDIMNSDGPDMNQIFGWTSTHPRITSTPSYLLLKPTVVYTCVC